MGAGTPQTENREREQNMKFIATAALSLCVCLVSTTANADLVLNFSGETNSSIVTWEATGTVTNDQNVFSVFNDNLGRLPFRSAWSTSVDNSIGDLFKSGVSTISDVVLSSPISYRVNGTEFATIDALDLGASNAAGGDSVDLDMAGNGAVSFPTLVSGSVLSWSGSGTFDLGSIDYDEFFEDGDNSASATINGGFFTVNVAEAVPEPSAVGILALVGLGFISRRRVR